MSKFVNPIEPNQSIYNAQRWVGCTPNDATDLTDMANAIYVGTGGDLRIAGEDGNDEIFKNVPDGFIFAGRITRVYSTDTTADDLILIY